MLRKGQTNSGSFKTHWEGIKVCQRCGKKFWATSGNRKYCDKCIEELLICPVCGKKKKDIYHKFCSNSCAGKWKYRNSENVRKGLLLGVVEANKETKEKRSKSIMRARFGKPRPELRGENNPNWKGGVYRTERQKEMGKVEYQNWRRKVFERDDYTCQLCGRRGVELNAHHIKSWKDFPDLRYNVSNGITLCVECHKKVHQKRNENIFIGIKSNKSRSPKLYLEES